MNIVEVIEIGLEKAGYDGLVCPGICGCRKGDISPGNCLADGCQPGYIHIHSESKKWIISPIKENISDEDIQLIIDQFDIFR